jgi:hypothetical protein
VTHQESVKLYTNDALPVLCCLLLFILLQAEIIYQVKEINLVAHDNLLPLKYISSMTNSIQMFISFL